MYDKEYLVPKKMISCPGCGQRYGHHNTKVDLNSEECSSCCKLFGRKDTNYVDAKVFIEEYILK